MMARYDAELSPEGRERTLRRIDEYEQAIALQRRELAAMALSAAEVARALEPMQSFVALLREDVAGDAME